MNDAVIRDLTEADIDWAAALLDQARQRYRQYSPIFWNPAENAMEGHKLFLQFLLTDPNTQAVGTSDGTGVLFATQRPDGLLVDDFAVASATDWAGIGRELLEDVLPADGGCTVIAGAAHAAKCEMLEAAGLQLLRQWWIADLSTATATDQVDGASATLIDAPPVYDPGGKVAMTQAWDGKAQSLRSLMARMATDAVLLVVPVDASATEQLDVVQAAGLTVASNWYGS